MASATIVVNALRPSAVALTQEMFFTPRAASVRRSWKVTMSGMTLDQLADLLRAHDLRATVVHSSDTDLETFRNVARTSLGDQSDFLADLRDSGCPAP